MSDPTTTTMRPLALLRVPVSLQTSTKTSFRVPGALGPFTQVRPGKGKEWNEGEGQRDPLVKVTSTPSDR